MAETIYTVDLADDQLWVLDPATPLSSASVGGLPKAPNGTPDPATSLLWIDGDARLLTVDTANLMLATLHGALPAGLASVAGMTADGTETVGISSSPAALWLMNTTTPGASTKEFDLPADLRYPTGLVRRPNGHFLTVSDVDGSVWDINRQAQTATQLATLPTGAWPISGIVRRNDASVVFITPTEGLWGLNETAPANSRKVGNLPTGLAEPLGLAERFVPPNEPPDVQIATPAQEVDGGAAVNLLATAIDPEMQPLTYTWASNGGGVFANEKVLNTVWTAPARTNQPQVVTLTLTVDDGENMVSAAVDITVQGLRLADWLHPTFEEDVLALLQANTNGNVIYADSDRGGTDTPLAGDIGIGPNDTLISRIQVQVQTAFVDVIFNDNDNPQTFTPRTYFRAGGAGRNLTVYLQTLTGVASVRADAQPNNSYGGGFARFRFTDQGDRTLLTTIRDSEQRFLLAFAEPPPVRLAGHVVGGEGVLTGDLDVAAPPNVNLEGRIEGGAGVLTGNIDIAQPMAVELAGGIVGGAGVLTGDLDVAAPTSVTLEGHIVGGAGVLTGDLDVAAQGSVNLEGHIEGGAGVLTGNLDVALPMAVELAGRIEGGAGVLTGDLDVGAPMPVHLAGGIVGGAGVLTGDLDTRGGRADLAGTVRGGEGVLTGRVRADLPHGRLSGPAYRLEIDFDNDGQYNHPNADVFIDLVGTLTAKRGRNFSGQIYGRNVAGTLECKLRNDTGTYDRFDPASPTYGKLVAGRLVRLTMAADTGGPFEPIWTGRLDRALQTAKRGGDARVTIRALGKLSELASRISLAYDQQVPTPEAMRRLLLAAGLKPADIGTLAGAYIMSHWWVRDLQGFDALRQTEETERGFVFETRDGFINMLPGAARRAAATPSSLVIDSNGVAEWPGLKFQLDDPLQDIANTVTAPVRTYATGAVTGVWASTSAFNLSPGQRVDVAAPYPTESSPSDHIGVAQWIEPVSGIDYDADPNLTITTRTTVGTMFLTLENTSATDNVWLPFLLVRAHPLVRTSDLLVERMDAASTLTYGRRDYPAPSQFLNDRLDAESYVAALLLERATPDPKARVTLEAENEVAAAMRMELGDIVTMRQPTGDQQMIVETIAHRVGGGVRHFVTLTLVPALPAGGRFTLDDPVLGRLDAGNLLGP